MAPLRRVISSADLTGLEELVENGVQRVHVIGLGRASLLTEIFTNEGSGTLIVRDRRELFAAEKHASGETGPANREAETATVKSATAGT
jgi:hypothetical protein